jgi:hypothetical protein
VLADKRNNLRIELAINVCDSPASARDLDINEFSSDIDD